MKTLVIIIALLGCLALLTGASHTQTKAEYKLDLDCSEKKMNARAAEGWQLAGISATDYNGVPTVQCAWKR